MTAREVWTGQPPQPDVAYWFDFPGGRTVDQLHDDLVRHWDGETTKRSVEPIPSAEELHALRAKLERAEAVVEKARAFEVSCLGGYEGHDDLGTWDAGLRDALRAAIKEHDDVR